ncbi:hypothetical protein TTHERM_00083510 (macronuclear) [Tetrahymena thermophila SB210]|uniref:Tetratricopeptide repeat protein n=1 Tax=Tetrahymena thermophila (strain SB210) TaxID=312017 RepID=Q236Z8_TETTS|nr:hypothetical protein TTHERM_00083510 [Tetrahymena thermophila SB210]EAR92352.3 hypothetical protein TTHERM_00083510 [Tetrahymena thermophila SB210]|eukprot:XP_001012597.3 hypothetical protein TTHERM_00083510 [Tetrahymena thermophila SB210]
MSIFGNSKNKSKQLSIFKDDKQNFLSQQISNPILGDNQETADKTSSQNPVFLLGQIQSLNSPQNKIQPQGMSKDELKTNVISNWPYLKLHKQTNQWLVERQNRKTWEVLNNYYEKRKQDMSITDRILFNRRVLNCANRLLKELILESEQENEEKLNNYLDRGIRAVFELYRFLNIYITRILPLYNQNDKNSQSTAPNILDQDQSFLTSEDEYLTEGIERSKPKTVNDVNTMYTLQNFNDLKLKYRKGHEIITRQKIEKMLSLKNIELNLHLELDQFFINVISLFNWGAFMLKKQSKHRIAYWFLKEAERISDQVLQSNNEELLNVIARVHISLANIYFEADRTPLAIEKIEKAILVLQCELRLRQTKWEFHKSKDADDAISKCVKTMITGMINLATYQEELQLYEEAYFSIQTADWFCTKYVKGLDEVRKYCSKIQSEFEKRYSDYLQQKGDLEVVAKHVFWVELLNLYKNWDEEQKNLPSTINKYINQQLYNIFRVRDLNKMQFIKHKYNQKISLKDLEKQQQDEKKKKKEIYNKYLEEMQEKKNQINNNPNSLSDQQQLEVEIKNASQVSQEQASQLDEQMKSRLQDKSNPGIQEKSISNKDISLHTNTQKKNSDQIGMSESSKQNSFQSDQIDEIQGEKVNSKDDGHSKNSQSDNTQIDLDDSASSDDFFGDIFEGFMSDDDDDSGKKKSDEDDISDSSLAEANQQFKQVQKKKYVKKKKEYGPNYNPKLLTTNMFFQPLENMKVNRDLHHNQTKLKHKNKQAKDELKKQKYQSTGFKSPNDFKQELEYNFFQPIKEAIQEGYTKKEIIQQFIRPQTAYEYDFQGMDLHIENKLQEDLGQDGYESKPFQWAKEDFYNEEEIEGKYRREQRYTRRILNIKRISELKNKCRPINYSNFPNKITFDRMIKDEAFVVEAKVGFSTDIQQKKKKVEMIIQSEIKHQGKKNLRDLIFKNRDNYLFQDANYLKHVYYEYTQKKKQQDKFKHQQNERDIEKQTRQSQAKNTGGQVNKSDIGQIVEKNGEYFDDSREFARQSKAQIEEHEKSPISTKNYNSSLTQINNHFNNTLTSIPSEIGFVQNKNQVQSKKEINYQNEPKSVKNQRLKWNIQEEPVSSSQIVSTTNIPNYTPGKNLRFLDKQTPKSQKRDKLQFHSEKNSPNRAQGKRKYLDTSDNVIKLAGQKSKILSKAQQIQKRYEHDQEDFIKFDNSQKASYKDRLNQMSQKSSKSLKIVVEEVTQSLQKDKKQLQQTKFKLGVSKNMAVDDNFGQRLIQHQEQLLTKSIQGISRKVMKDYMSFTEVVRLARLKKKMEIMQNKQQQQGSLTKF